MKLTELRPAFEGGELVFDCPKCRGHRISVPVEGPTAWRSNGRDLEVLTIEPSIDHDFPWTNMPDVPAVGCRWHGHIEKGEVRTV